MRNKDEDEFVTLAEAREMLKDVVPDTDPGECITVVTRMPKKPKPEGDNEPV